MEDLRNEDKIFPLDGQSERTIQMLEDMLWECAIDFQGSWSKYLPLAEFAYNNNYQATIGIVLYEALCGRNVGHLFIWMRWRAKASWTWLNYCVIWSDRENISKNVGSSKSTKKLYG